MRALVITTFIFSYNLVCYSLQAISYNKHTVEIADIDDHLIEQKNDLKEENFASVFKLKSIFFLQVQDVEGVELCGTLKNVVAIAAGLRPLLLSTLI